MGPVLGVAIFQTRPLAGFVIAGCINLAVGLYIALAVPESAPGHRKSDRLATSHAATVSIGLGQPAGEPVSSSSRPAGASAWREIARDGGFWVWTAGMMFVWGAYDMIQSFLPLHLQDRQGALWAYSAILTTNALICVFLQLPFSRRLRVAPFARAAGLSKLPFALGFIGFAVFRLPALLIMSMVILSLGEVWGSAVQVRFIPEHARPALLGRYMGLSMVSELGKAFASPAAGFLMAATGGTTVFFMAAGMTLVGGLLLFFAGRAQDRHRPS